MTDVTVQGAIGHDALALRICPECGYSLESLPSEGICPECGERYDQQYVVLFGETPEGTSRSASRLNLAIGILFAALLLGLSLMPGKSLGPVRMALVLYVVGVVTFWAIRRFNLQKEILFQVWMNERGFAVHRPATAGRWLPVLEKSWGIVYWIGYVSFTVADAGRTTMLAFVLIGGTVGVGIVALVWLANRKASRSRGISTGDPRLPTLTRWFPDDTIDVSSIRPDIARLRVTSRSYLGDWKWREWRAVEAYVRLTTDQANELRRRVGLWIASAARK